MRNLWCSSARPLRFLVAGLAMTAASATLGACGSDPSAPTGASSRGGLPGEVQAGGSGAATGGGAAQDPALGSGGAAAGGLAGASGSSTTTGGEGGIGTRDGVGGTPATAGSAGREATGGEGGIGTRDGVGGTPATAGSAGREATGGEGGIGTSDGVGGTPATGGSGGATPPGTTSTFLPSPEAVDKMDILFVIDNSISMADKQQILQAALPQLVDRLIDPVCLDATGNVTQTSSVAGCPTGSAPQFTPVEDMHIGVTTSSLGGHGGVLCSPEHGEQYYNPTQNDGGRLIARLPSGEVALTYESQGFLAWDPSGTTHSPPGESDAPALVHSFLDLVAGAGEQGCGYEATLEAWYRFLIDPEPPEQVLLDTTTGGDVAVPSGVDQMLLAQRAQFLRPDSLVAIIMLTDENDCSIVDSGLGWMVAQTSEGAMPRSTSVCDSDPNDPCCMSCVHASWPEGCSEPALDPKCQEAQLHPIDTDRLNLRCYEQKRRFGLDLLYPVSRYITGLTSPRVPNRSGELVLNPLFGASAVYPDGPRRIDSSLVYLVGIIGIPWQDVATDESLSDSNLLEYLTASELTARGLWDDIVGDPDASPPVPPGDPFLRESFEPRSGTNPRTGIAITPPEDGAGGNAINGHEYVIARASDLQYACIFPLAEPRECADVPAGVGCDCKVSNEISQRPLCEGTVQHYAKAYPAGRLLQVLQGVGANSMVASICPKNTEGDVDDPSYGYNPAVAALIDRLRLGVDDRCLGQQLETQAAGSLVCRVIEVSPPGAAVDCSTPGRASLTAATDAQARAFIEWRGLCDSDTSTDAPDCAGFGLCEILPVEDGAERDSCLNDPDGAVSAVGYCYLDALAPTPIGNPELVAQCPPDQRRLIRFAGAGLPAAGAQLLVLCPD